MDEENGEGRLILIKLNVWDNSSAWKTLGSVKNKQTNNKNKTKKMS